MGGRVEAVQQWLAQRADSAIGRLALQWFRSYFEASRNSGSATTLYAFLSVAPLLLAVTALFHASGSDTNAFAERLVDHNNLTGASASLVRDTFGTASQNALAASASAVVGFLIWGIGIGQIYQDVYARAWGIQVRTLSDQVRFAVWFFVLSGAVGLFVLSGGALRNAGWAALIPAWLCGSLAFWLWTPRYLLRGQIGLRRLFPGAILATILIGGAIATSPFFLGPWVNSEGRDFGSFGVVLALVAWAFVLATMSLACAVFSPVWIAWRADAAGKVSC